MTGKSEAKLQQQLRAARESLKRKQRRRVEEARERLRMKREAKRKNDQQAKNRDELKELRKNSEEELRKVRAELEAKDTELRKLSARSNGSPAEGRIKLEVEVQKVVEEDFIFSPYTYIGGASFRLGCRAEMENGTKFLVASLFCNDNAESNTHSTLTAFTLTLASPKYPGHKSSIIDFLPSKLSYRWLPRPWNAIISPVYEHVKNGCFTLEAQVKVLCYHKNALIDFASPDPDLSDVILLVGEKEFNVSRNFLAHFCGYFKVLFSSNFAEKKKEKIELKNIDAGEFEEMLHFLYPQRKKVTAATVKGLLRMADFFDVHAVRVECVEFLLDTAGFTLAAKLQFSEEFRLPELQYHLTESLKQADDLQKVIDSADFGGLSVALKNSLLQKHFKLARK